MKDEELVFDVWIIVKNTKLFQNDKIWLKALLFILVIDRMCQDGSDYFLVPISFVELSQKVNIVLHQSHYLVVVTKRIGKHKI